MDRNRSHQNHNRPTQTLEGDRLTTPGLAPGTGMRRIEPAEPARSGAKADAPRAGYGLPCANCGTYYTADLNACPVCQSTERVAANDAGAEIVNEVATQMLPAHVSGAQVTLEGELVPDEGQLMAERDRFLREYKAKLFATHKLNAAVTFHCTLDRNHASGYEPASVCKSCYEEMEQKADRLDAALRMDLKEAAQIIYEAVWSDPTPGDPGRTYQNAAEALLVELRRRAGTTLLLGSLKPYAH